MKNFNGKSYAVATDGTRYKINKASIVNDRLYINISPLQNYDNEICLLYDGEDWLMRDKLDEDKFNVKYIYRRSDIKINQLNLIDCF